MIPLRREQDSKKRTQAEAKPFLLLAEECIVSQLKNWKLISEFPYTVSVYIIILKLII